jgi:hypothetical protein
MITMMMATTLIIVFIVGSIGSFVFTTHRIRPTKASTMIMVISDMAVGFMWITVKNVPGQMDG